MFYARICVLIIFALYSIEANALILKNKNNNSKPLSAFSFLISDSSGNIIIEKNSKIVRPIASISKLLVSVLASNQDLDESLEIKRNIKLSTSIPRGVDILSRRDLLILALVKSDNLAAQVLCDNIDMCIHKMNDLAYHIDMKSTSIVEPTGLDNNNVSTAEDLVKLLKYVESNYIVSHFSSMKSAIISIGKRKLIVNNTNPLTAKFNTLVSKTGFTNPAGGCLVMALIKGGQSFYYVLLGSKNTKSRISEMERLINS
jgi:D-alanyl-D-alanine carboxypeptidase